MGDSLSSLSTTAWLWCVLTGYDHNGGLPFIGLVVRVPDGKDTARKAVLRLYSDAVRCWPARSPRLPPNM